MNIVVKFAKKQLEIADITDWFRKELPELYSSLEPSEQFTIIENLMEIYESYHRKRRVGGFLSAVLSDSLMKSFLNADLLNRKAMIVYPFFIQHVIPIKIVRQLQEEYEPTN